MVMSDLFVTTNPCHLSSTQVARQFAAEAIVQMFSFHQTDQCRKKVTLY